jgi:hypothetical protein
MAFDLARSAFTAAEQREFASWAAKFIERGKKNVDFARDTPWWPDATYGEDHTNPATYSNSATWQRAMAVWAAAAVGGSTLQQTLEWNFQHTTRGGRDYGWDNLLEGLILDGTGGRVTDERYRRSIHYGHYAWFPTVLIADVARNAGFRVDLFRYRTKRSGYSVFTPVAYYARYLTTESISAELETTSNGGTSWPKTAARLRAQYEVLYRNASDPALVRILNRVVNYGGPDVRGDNYDVYIVGNGALFGRGPKGPRST